MHAEIFSIEEQQWLQLKWINGWIEAQICEKIKQLKTQGGGYMDLHCTIISNVLYVLNFRYWGIQSSVVWSRSAGSSW